MTNEALNTEVRKSTGKEQMKKLRAQGVIPAIYYHHGEEPIPLTVSTLEFNRVLRTGNKVIDITIDKKSKKVLIRDIQFHPVTEAVLHIDFQGVKLSEAIHVTVPVKFTGSAIGVREGGILEPLMHELDIRCKVSDVPHELTIDVSELTRGQGIYIKDLDFPGVELLNPHDAMVVMVGAPAGTSTSAEEDEGAEETTEEEGTEE